MGLSLRRTVAAYLFREQDSQEALSGRGWDAVSTSESRVIEFFYPVCHKGQKLSTSRVTGCVKSRQRQRKRWR